MKNAGCTFHSYLFIGYSEPSMSKESAHSLFCSLVKILSMIWGWMATDGKVLVSNCSGQDKMCAADIVRGLFFPTDKIYKSEVLKANTAHHSNLARESWRISCTFNKCQFIIYSSCKCCNCGLDVMNSLRTPCFSYHLASICVVSLDGDDRSNIRAIVALRFLGGTRN